MCIIISIEDMRNEQPIQVAFNKVQAEGWADTDTTETPDEHEVCGIGGDVDVRRFKEALDYVMEAALASKNHSKFKVGARIAYLKACLGLVK